MEKSFCEKMVMGSPVELMLVGEKHISGVVLYSCPNWVEIGVEEGTWIVRAENIIAYCLLYPKKAQSI